MCVFTCFLLFTFFGIICCKNVDNIYNPSVFQYNEDVSVNTLDPAFIKSQSEIWIGSQIYEGLVALDSQLKPISALAKRWEISENGNVYKFVLNTQAKFCFTNVAVWGKPQTQFQNISVQDVLYSFYRVIDPKTASPGAWIFSDKIDIPEGMSIADLKKSKNAPFIALNDSTIQITLKSPFPAFLSLLATNYAWIVPQNTQNWKTGALGRSPIGTGPFYLKKWEEDVRLVMLKNQQYHQFENDVRLPYLEAINVDFVKNKQTAFMQFLAGKYDFFNGIDGTFKDDILGRDGQIKAKYKHRIKALITPFLNTEYVGFFLGDSLDGKMNPFADVNLRKALQWSVDRKSMLKYLRNGLGTEGNGGFVPPSLTGEQVNYQDLFQLDSAKKYLASSKYVKAPKKFAKLKITVTADYLDIAVYLQKSWEQIGIPVEVDLQAGGMIRQLRNQGKLGMFRGSWIADYPDAENFLSCFFTNYFSPNGPNYTHFTSAKFDQLFERIAFGTYEIPSKRIDDIQTANKLLIENAPVFILYYDKSLRLMHPYIEGLSNDAANRLDLKRVKKKTRN